MKDKTYRLSIVPERAPDVRRVIDFDGHHTLHDVHDAIQTHFELDDDHLYAFFLSGKYWDSGSEIRGSGGGAATGATRSKLFRLGLKKGQTIAYLFDFGDELRHDVRVVDIQPVPQRLARPALIEAVGDAPPQYPDFEEDDDGDDDDGYDDDGDDGYEYEDVAPEFKHLISLVQQLDRALDEYDREATMAAGQRAHTAAMQLADALGGDRRRVESLETVVHRDLIGVLLALPLDLAQDGLVDEAAALCVACARLDPENFLPDRAVILAGAGRREEALAQVAENLKQVDAGVWVRIKAGDVHRELGDVVEAERVYREVLEAEDSGYARDGAVERLCELLDEQGRQSEADALERAEDQRPLALGALGRRSVDTREAPKVGRNDACPCGSGKKYKKCCASDLPELRG